MNAKNLAVPHVVLLPVDAAQQIEHALSGAAERVLLLTDDETHPLVKELMEAAQLLVDAWQATEARAAGGAS